MDGIVSATSNTEIMLIIIIIINVFQVGTVSLLCPLKKTHFSIVKELEK